mmetsp:Transcript_30286/g.34854  ORF Transcript_30286/g.34854 Transcript_30286/m.34854 type:complete len:488 (+) Transcript_30286:57-1520(+)
MEQSQIIEDGEDETRNLYGSLESSRERQASSKKKRSLLLKRPHHYGVDTGSVYGNLFSPRHGRLSSPREKQTSANRTDNVYGNLFNPHNKSPVANHEHKRQSTHSFVYTMLNSKSKQWQATIFKTIISLIIVTDFVFFTLSTVPEYKNNPIFHLEEGVVSYIFLVEYIARIVIITESKKYRPLGSIKGRLKYMMSFHAIIDACATFPYFMELLHSKYMAQLPTLTYLRFFRLLRILRTNTVSNSMSSLYRVIYYNREILNVALVLGLSLMMSMAVLLYHLRPLQEKQGNDWSMLTTMYYSTLLLTGQGGAPDEVDLPWYTKVVILLTSSFSIVIFAIPGSMLTWGFEAEAQRVASKARKRFLRAKQKESQLGYISDSSYSSSSVDESESELGSSDEEYLNLIAGEDDSISEASAENDLLLVDGSKNNDLIEKGDQRQHYNQQFDRDVLASSYYLKLSTKVDNLEAKVDETNRRMDQLIELLSKEKSK